MKYLAVLLLAVAGLQLASAKTFERCELAEELVRQGFNKFLIRDWVCLIEIHSHRSTRRVMQLEDGTTQWGLYQINDRYWCTAGYPGGLCNIACEGLLNDNITDSSNCADKIFKENGFGAWQGWVSSCQSESHLPDISNCDIWG